jgi:RNA-directed DNA polymerase
VAESGADTNSYGFRPYRSVRDAVEQGYKVFRQKGSCPWILEADIQSCFDEMSHDWILANIPVDKGLLRQWLKCGYFEKHEFFPTKTGVPQGSPIAPAIANMVLDGLEKAVKAAFPRKTGSISCVMPMTSSSALKRGEVGAKSCPFLIDFSSREA